MCFVIKNWIFKEDQICFYVKERIRFLLKSTDVFCEKLKKKKKKKVILSRKIRSIFYE